MDLLIFYGDFQKNVVVTQFYGSDFFGKSAKDILHGFEAWLGPSSNRKNDANLFWWFQCKLAISWYDQGQSFDQGITKF